MRIFRSLRPILAICAFALAGAVPAMACNASSAHVSGKFDEGGRFVVASMLDANGNAVEGASGLVCSKVTMNEGVSLTAANYTDQTVWLVGDVDSECGSLHVSSYTDCEKTAMATVASARTANAAPAAGCGSWKAAKSASAAGCGSAAKAASAKTASASGCGSAAKAASANAAGCAPGCTTPCGPAGTSAKAASAKTASACGPDCTKPCCAEGAAAKSAEAKPIEDANRMVFAVSGMTCGGCTSKVESAVSKLDLAGVKGCEVNLESATAVVTVVEDKAIDADVIAKAITAVGFPATLQDSNES